MDEKKLQNPPVTPEARRANLDWIESLKLGTFLRQNHGSKATCERVVVITPPGRINEYELGRRVSRLATLMSVPVLVLGLPGGPEDWYREQIKLHRIAAVVQSRETPARAYCPDFDSWEPAIRQIYLPGDLFVCLAQHYIQGFMWKKQPVGAWLQSKFNVSVHVLDGLAIEEFPRI